MALTVQRWLLVAVLACATLAVWLLPATDGGEAAALHAASASPQPSRALFVDWWDLNFRLRETNDRLRALELRDSILARNAGGRAQAGSLTVLLDRRFSDSIRAGIEQAIVKRATGLRLTGKTSIIVAIVADTDRTPHGLPRYTQGVVSKEVFVPDGDGSGACFVLGRVHADPNRLSMTFRRFLLDAASSQAMAQSFLGPCALFSAFGAPGPEILHWLRITGWQFARVMDWTTTASPWQYPRHYNVSPYSPRSLAETFALGDTPWWITRDFLSNDAVACLAARQSRCASAFAVPYRYERDTVWSSHVASAGAWDVFGGFGPARRSSLGPQGGWLISDMIHSMGRERFAQFWTSPLPPDSAYRAATGEDLSAWVQRWATNIYGTDTLGPRLPANAPIAGLVAILLALGVAIGFARERRVA